MGEATSETTSVAPTDTDGSTTQATSGLGETGHASDEGSSSGDIGQLPGCEPVDSFLRFAPDTDLPAQLGGFQGAASGWCDLEIVGAQEEDGAFTSTVLAVCADMTGRRGWERFEHETMTFHIVLQSSDDPASLFASLPRWARVRVATEPESPGSGRQSWLVVESFEGSTAPVDPPKPGLRYPALAVTSAETIVPSVGLLTGVFEEDWYAGLDLEFGETSCGAAPGPCGSVAAAVNMSWNDREALVLEPGTSAFLLSTVPETSFQTWLSSAWVNDEPRCTDMPASAIDVSLVALQP